MAVTNARKRSRAQTLTIVRDNDGYDYDHYDDYGTILMLPSPGVSSSSNLERRNHRGSLRRSLILPYMVFTTAVLVGSWSSVRWTRESYAFCPATNPLRQQHQHNFFVGETLKSFNLGSCSSSCKAFTSENENNGSDKFDATKKPIGGTANGGHITSTATSTVACSLHKDLLSSSFRSSLLPPWLERFENATKYQLQEEIRSLEFELLRDHGFSVQDAADVVKAIYFCGGVGAAAAADEDGGTCGGQQSRQQQRAGMILGSVSFCKLLLRLEAETVMEQQPPYPQTTTTTSLGLDLSTSTLHRSSHRKSSTQKNDLVSKDVLLASILHYSECVTARHEGVYDQVQYAVYRGVTDSPRGNLFSAYGQAHEVYIPQVGENDKRTALVLDVHESTSVVDPGPDEGIFSFSSVSGNHESHAPDDSSARRNTIVTITAERDGISDIFSVDSLLLAQCASRLKRTEILTNVLLSGKRPLATDEYKAIQTLLVSLTDDWRALAIRCVASLYRLEAIVEGIPMGTREYVHHRTPEAILTAKESLRVYANLSRRLGLHRLQTQLEAQAFQVLYPRQYSAASALFLEHGTSMTAISLWLTNKLEKMLREDSSLMYELEHVQVLSRVKEPYSFWKKLLKNRLVSSSENDDNSFNKGRTRTQRFLVKQTKELSIVDVNDGVALRVILQARKLHGDESDETTRARERMLCYYVQDLVRSFWPETDQSRVKDYIRYPKANGYQSLHHTSKVTRNKQDFFFEVQIRSEEMHRLAEFGLAAHWTYKSGFSHPVLSESSSRENPIQSLDFNGEVSLSQSSFSPFSGDGLVPRKSEVRSTSAISDESLYVRALGNARQSLMQSQVYVFLAGPSSPLERGRLLSLPVGSLIIDAVALLRSTEDFPFRLEELRVWRNGNLAQLEERVRNGDMVVLQPSIPNEKLLAGGMQMEEESSLVM
jgi:ppGpp synthetase/RelA/SpoT-type nucleotidyltranferase